ncbi:MAG TPA: VWA domain-containing protein [Vicinamibacterales bacterium]|nr:VWA domain-containing protein [Vicinamibacterales bacterium]
MKARLALLVAFCLLPFAFLTAQQPTFRAGVTLVTTDVIPRDQNGRFVPDLTIDNFNVLEDGQPQKLTSFMMVRGGRTFNLLLPPPAASTSPDGLVLPPPKPRTDDTAGRVLLIFIDDLHFEPELSPHVRRAMQTIIDTLIHDGDLVAVVSSGPSYLSIGPTYDKKLISEAVGKIRGTGLIPSEIFASLESSQGPADIRARAQTAFYTAYSILGDLESVNNKRKALIYVSTGYDFDPYAEGRASRDRIQGGRFSEPSRFMIDETNPYFSLGRVTADSDLHSLLRELTLSANRANASIYTLDPRGLSGVVDAGTYLDQSEWRTHLQKTISTLRYMAETTGGFAIVNTNDIAGELKRVDAETSDYYVLGFYSSNADPAKRTRSLAISVNRPDVTVASRKEYSLKTPGKPPAPPPLKTKK